MSARPIDYSRWAHIKDSSSESDSDDGKYHKNPSGARRPQVTRFDQPRSITIPGIKKEESSTSSVEVKPSQSQPQSAATTTTTKNVTTSCSAAAMVCPPSTTTVGTGEMKNTSSATAGCTTITSTLGDTSPNNNNNNSDENRKKQKKMCTLHHISIANGSMKGGSHYWTQDRETVHLWLVLPTGTLAKDIQKFRIEEDAQSISFALSARGEKTEKKDVTATNNNNSSGCTTNVLLKLAYPLHCRHTTNVLHTVPLDELDDAASWQLETIHVIEKRRKNTKEKREEDKKTDETDKKVDATAEPSTITAHTTSPFPGDSRTTCTCHGHSNEKDEEEEEEGCVLYPVTEEECNMMTMPATAQEEDEDRGSDIKHETFRMSCRVMHIELQKAHIGKGAHATYLWWDRALSDDVPVDVTRFPLRLLSESGSEGSTTTNKESGEEEEKGKKKMEEFKKVWEEAHQMFRERVAQKKEEGKQ